MRADSDVGRELLATCPGLFTADPRSGLVVAGEARGHEMVLEKVRRRRITRRVGGWQERLEIGPG